MQLITTPKGTRVCILETEGGLVVLTEEGSRWYIRELSTPVALPVEMDLELEEILQ